MKELIMAKCTIQVKGNLARDVETKYSKAGKAYSVLSVGSTPSKKNAAGEWENGETMWFNVTVFAELNPFEFKKGSPVEVEGTFVARHYTKKDGTQGFNISSAHCIAASLKHNIVAEAVIYCPVAVNNFGVFG